MAIRPYDYIGLCEAFINQSQIKGVTAQGRMSFNGTKLYSYNSLLAEFDTSTNTLLVDHNIAKYSNTSRRHFKILTETSLNYTIFQVDLDLIPSQNLTLYVDKLYLLLAQYNRARRFKYIRKSRIIKTYNEAQEYIDYINIDKRTKPYKQFKQFFNTMFEAKLL